MDVFSDRLTAWQAYCATPWGRIRYAVVEHTLRREAEALAAALPPERAGVLRVLDVGGGDARDSLPLALAGHDVTVLDPSASWLAAARERAEAEGVALRTVEGDLASAAQSVGGGWDLVLCHFVLHYLPDDAAPARALAALVRPGGVVSVMVPNPDAMVLRRLVTAGPRAALDELGAATVHAVTFDHEVRKVAAPALSAALAGAGLPVQRRYGARTANDLLVDDAAKHDPEAFAALLDLELALCDREPFTAVAAMTQLVARRA